MEFEKQTPMAIANFVIKFAQTKGKSVSNLQLQKILYFIQTAFLLETGKGIISGEFSRWQYGPVLQEVYSAYKDNGAALIDNLAVSITKNDSGGYSIGEISPTDDSSLVSQEAFKLLEEVTDNLLKQDPWELVELSHQQSIWKKYEKQIAYHMAPNYKDEEILSESENYKYLWTSKIRNSLD